MKQISQSDLINLLDRLDVLLEECERDKEKLHSAGFSSSH